MDFYCLPITIPKSPITYCFNEQGIDHPIYSILSKPYMSPSYMSLSCASSKLSIPHITHLILPEKKKSRAKVNIILDIVKSILSTY